LIESITLERGYPSKERPSALANRPDSADNLRAILKYGASMKRHATILALLVLFIAGLLQAFPKEPQYRALPKKLAQKPAKGLAIAHVRLFDSEAAEVRSGQTVIVAGDKIIGVGPDRSLKLPNGVETIDGTGMTLLPGLVDMHAHLQPSAGLPYIASGVTTVRDLGNRMNPLLELKKAWDSGEEIGPQILMAGPLNGSRGKGELVSTEEEVKAAIEHYKNAGYVQIKILGSFKPSLVPCAVKSAHANEMRVSGHVPEGMKADEFVQAGVDEIQHFLRREEPLPIGGHDVDFGGRRGIPLGRRFGTGHSMDQPAQAKKHRR
jgi:hypothetical protein